MYAHDCSFILPLSWSPPPAQELVRMKVTPPFVPEVKGMFDTSNFDVYEEQPPEPYYNEGSEWDKDF